MRKSVLSARCSHRPRRTGVRRGANAGAAAPPAGHRQHHASRQDYRFRGISQTFAGPGDSGRLRLRPRERHLPRQLELERQPGAGFAGGSASRWTSTAAGRRPSATSVSTSATIYYYYPNAEFNVNTGSAGGSSKFDNWEIYIGGSWKWITAKFFYALDDYFGLATSRRPRATRNQNTGALLGTHGDSKGTTTSTSPQRSGHREALDRRPLRDAQGQELQRARLQRLEARRDLRLERLGARRAPTSDTDAEGRLVLPTDCFGMRQGNEATPATSTVVLSVSKTF